MKDFWIGIREVGKTNPKKFIRSDGVTVMIFGAPWYGPCRLLMPKMEAAAREYNSVTFLYIDTDDNSQAAVDCEIRSVPSTVFLVNGKPVETRLGDMDKNYIDERIKSVLEIWRKEHMPDREKELELIIEEAKKELDEIRKGVSWKEACLAMCNNMDNPDDKVIVYPVAGTGERYKGFEGIGILYCKHAIHKNEGNYRIAYEHK